MLSTTAPDPPPSCDAMLTVAAMRRTNRPTVKANGAVLRLCMLLLLLTTVLSTIEFSLTSLLNSLDLASVLTVWSRMPSGQRI